MSAETEVPHTLILDPVTIRALKRFTRKAPDNENVWYSTWLDVLKSLFPSSKRYLIAPVSIIYRKDDDDDDDDKDSEYRIPDFAVLLEQGTGKAYRYKIVLLVEIKNTHRWTDAGKVKLEEQIMEQAEYAMKSEDRSIHYLAAIGPFWRYGIKSSNGQGLNHLIDWHFKIHTPKACLQLYNLAQVIHEAYSQSSLRTQRSLNA